MYISRHAESRITHRVDRRKILLLLGPRQAGKTTLLRHLYAGKQVRFLNLDRPSDVQALELALPLDPVSAIASLGSPEVLVIDEAQRKPEIARVVKGWYDSELPMEMILTGSSSLNLLDVSAEPLTGRNEKVFLPPLSFSEILTAQPWYTPDIPGTNAFIEQIQSLLFKTVVYGGYPDAVRSSDPVGYLETLLSDYVFKDVFSLGLVKSPEMIRRLVSLLAYQVGSIVSTNELSRTLGISRVTVDRYLTLLEETFIIFRLPAFSTNPRKEISKSKKIYFWDAGVKNAAIGAFSLDPLRPDIGSLWENWVIAEIAKKSWSPMGLPLSFWRSKAGSEVDLIWKDVRTGEKRAFEIKWSKGKATKAFTTAYRIPVTVINRESILEHIV